MIVPKFALVLFGAAGAVVTGSVPAQAATTEALPVAGTALCEHAVDHAKDVADAAAALASDRVSAGALAVELQVHPERPEFLALSAADAKTHADVTALTHARGQAFGDLCRAGVITGRA